MEMHRQWMKTVEGLKLDSQMLSAREIEELVSGGKGAWAGGIYTASDGRAEPTLAPSAIARAATVKGS